MSLNNQFYEHPLLETTVTVLGSGVGHTTAGETGVDILLCPPPTSSEISRQIGQVLLINTSGDDIPAAVGPAVNFSLILKTATGEAVLDSSGSALDDGENLDFVLETVFLLRPTDRGIYLRISATGVTNFTAFGTFNDIRRIELAATDLNDTVQTALSGKTNTVRKVAMGGEENENLYLVIVNTDSIDHDVSLFLYNGTTQILFETMTVTTGRVEQFLNFTPPALLEGWEWRAQLVEPIATLPCSFYIGYSDVNLYPVRRDQGGAY